MPVIYLSPSTQEGNPYTIGGSEEYYMNLLADELIPYLVASGIQYTRNTKDMTAVSSIRASNSGNYDLHLALHSNAAPDALSGQVRGTDIYYAPNSVSGERAAGIIARHLQQIYPLPQRVRTLSTTRIGEVRQTRAPAVFIELAYHDNPQDANWIVNNLPEIARNIARSLTEYFGIPFVEPQAPQRGTVATAGGGLNIRSRPSTDSVVLTQLPNGAALTILGRTGNWYVVRANGTTGYAARQYVRTA